MSISCIRIPSRNQDICSLIRTYPKITYQVQIRSPCACTRPYRHNARPARTAWPVRRIRLSYPRLTFLISESNEKINYWSSFDGRLCTVILSNTDFEWLYTGFERTQALIVNNRKSSIQTTYSEKCSTSAMKKDLSYQYAAQSNTVQNPENHSKSIFDIKPAPHSPIKNDLFD